MVALAMCTDELDRLWSWIVNADACEYLVDYVMENEFSNAILLFFFNKVLAQPLSVANDVMVNIYVLVKNLKCVSKTY